MLTLHKPRLEELSFRQELLADEDTCPITTPTAAVSIFRGKSGKYGTKSG